MSATVVLNLTEAEAIALLDATSAYNQTLERHCVNNAADEETRQRLIVACEMSSKLGAAMRRAFPV